MILNTKKYSYTCSVNNFAVTGRGTTLNFLEQYVSKTFFALLVVNAQWIIIINIFLYCCTF